MSFVYGHHQIAWCHAVANEMHVIMRKLCAQRICRNTRCRVNKQIDVFDGLQALAEDVTNPHIMHGDSQRHGSRDDVDARLM